MTKPAARGLGRARSLPNTTSPAVRKERSLRRRLGEVLVAQGVLDGATLVELLARQADHQDHPTQPRLRLGQMVVERGLADEHQVAEALAEALDLPVVDLSVSPVDPEAARLIPRPMAERFGLLVLGQGEYGLRVAASDPTNVLALDDVRIHTRERTLDVVVATHSQVRDHLARVWSMVDDAADAVMLMAIEEADPELDLAGEADQTPTVRLLDALLADAVRGGASDVHVQPQIDGIRIRFRVDGLLHDVMTVPRAAGPSMASRLKILSGLDIAERRVPQDGRTRLTVDGRTIDARVSSLPSVHGEKLVVRLLPGPDSVPALDALGLEPAQHHALRRVLGQSQGLVLITGPTGSGKTNTLYSAVHAVMTPERNVVTLEDPVEMQLQGITQVQVNERAGMTFARGLRAILRQDPDVVLVGEIRDLETAELALRSSLTGHLVLSTLHTNDAVSALTRLVDMGLPDFLVASSLALVVAQRLVRVPCPRCAVPYQPPDDVLAALGLSQDDVATAQPRRGVGCGFCRESGYRGRTGVFEVLNVTSDVRRSLLAERAEESLLDVARQHGFRTLRDVGLARAAEGGTTYEEALRVTHADAYAVP